MNATVLQGDCIEVLRTLPDCSVDAVVTDPPYGLSFMGRKWDYDVPSVDVWAECLRVLKPGGHLLAFAGTRTQHRMCCRIEDAGFEIRDMIAWVYGSGFPKSLNVAKAIESGSGRPEDIRRMQMGGDYVPSCRGRANYDHGAGSAMDAGVAEWQPASEAARQWQGWGTALKPALEPITVARKPLGTCATNVLEMIESELRERGVRGEILWKQESASGVARSRKRAFSGSTRHSEQPGTYAKTADENETQNGAHLSQRSSGQLGTSGPSQTQDGSESLHDCTTRDCENQSSLRTVVDAHVAENESETSSRSTTSTAEGHSTESVFTERSTPNLEGMDSPLDTESFAGIATGLTGSTAIVRISRDSEGFFLWPNGLPKFVNGSPLTVAENVLNHGTGAINVDGCRVENLDYDPSKVQRQQSNRRTWEASGFASDHTQPTYNAAGRWPANLIHNGSEEVVALFPQSTSGANPTRRGGMGYHGAVGQDECHAPRGAESGSAARFFYCAKASKSDRDEGNKHPTVKPTDLMRYLCRLVTPPGGVVLDPFMGSGSTGKAAVLEGFRFVGIEREAEYVEIAKARIAAAQPPLFT